MVLFRKARCSPLHCTRRSSDICTFIASKAPPPPDKLTGLLTREGFLAALDPFLKQVSPAPGAVVYFDVQRFKLVNGMLGTAKGDECLLHIAHLVRQAACPTDFACRLDGDRFVFYALGEPSEVERRINVLFNGIANFDIPYTLLCNAGIYVTGDPSVTALAAMDGAILAQGQIKGSFIHRFYYYDDQLRQDLIREHELLAPMSSALQKHQFLVCYQPQYNHATGMLVGAEALVRWQHPKRGLIPPDQFLPAFERNGFIIQLDQYVFEEVCAFLRRQLDAQVDIVPISINLTRYDFFSPRFLETLESIRKRYDVSPRYIRIEITESSALGNSRFINEALNILHGYGYLVEMDDFGNGYSSLSVLKDIDFDLIKLDTRFFEDGLGKPGRGATILTSVVRMLNWLQLPMIAEGVERAEQADFLQSIGCNYIQGFLYAKPMQAADFEALLKGSHVGDPAPGMRLIQTMDAGRFWSSESLETLIFSNFVGGAAIFEYHQDAETAELLRVNRKYLQELGMNQSEQDLINKDVLVTLDEPNRALYLDAIRRAIQTRDEQECETWRTVTSACCGQERICVRAAMRMVGSSKGHYVFYVRIRNITAEKRSLDNLLDSERRFKAASEQVNIYYWEYTVATHEMRPCFRCMRDLGLPALLTNYPDSAIEMGIFPPEVADMYRDWHRQIDAGVPQLSAVIPLTVGRIPFHVRYTTEFDESGHPVKAYGSAALVVDGPEAAPKAP